MIPDNIIKMMADIGFMASSSGYSKHAFGIFMGIEAVKPDSVLPCIGYAMEFMNKKKYQEAISILKKQGLAKEPDNAAVKAFIGLALMLDGHNKECEDYLASVENASDSAAATMASSILKEARAN